MKFIQMKFVHTPLQGRLEQGMKKYVFMIHAPYPGEPGTAFES